MIFFGGAFAGAVAAATPMVYGALADGVAILLLAAAGVEATTDLLVLHVFPGNSLNVALELIRRLSARILTRGGESSGDIVPGEVGQTSLLASFVEKLLDVVPVVPFHHFEFESLEKLLDDREDIIPWQNVGLASQVRLES